MQPLQQSSGVGQVSMARLVACTIIVSALALGAASAPNGHRKQYENLDKYLETQCDGNSIDQILECFNALREKSMSNAKKDKDLAPLVELIESLLPKRIYKCDLKEYDDLRALERASLGKTLAGQDEGSYSRLDRLARFIAFTHADDCTSVYVQRFFLDSQFYKDEKFSPVRPFLNGLIADLESVKPRLSSQRQEEYVREQIDQLTSLKPFDAQEEAPYFYQQLLRVSKDHPNSKYLHWQWDEELGQSMQFDKHRLGNFIREYLVESCEHFVEFFHHIFVPASFEFRSNNKKMYEEFALDFYYNWAYFKICKRMINQQENVISSIVKLARQLDLH